MTIVSAERKNFVGVVTFAAGSAAETARRFRLSPQAMSRPGGAYCAVNAAAEPCAESE
ncbi:hypothetical protein OJE16_24395 [Pantoea tagorei]|uniref:hypothetical protein n=1 Tax=unclassified Pantoea TaxID=2630326 RepID=UPI001EF71128|nr:MULTISPECIES: hypothetical protein [unclassified Pantoea]MCG7365451.1 hypothetical protein [Pantoea sp. ACRSH]MCG7395597.1 hypothetical protein [Pantoea sp. ACRSC]